MFREQNIVGTFDLMLTIAIDLRLIFPVDHVINIL